LIGNIGKPYLATLLTKNQPEIYVAELSSHQLFNLKKSPHVAVFLNFFPEHLDYYKNLKEYLMAKANITLWQGPEDFFIYNKENKYIKKIAKKTLAKKIPISFDQKILKKYSIKKIPFVGNFYLLNIAAAAKVAEIFKIKKEIVKKVIEKFRPLLHRLEFVGKFKGVYFYNDSLSTIPETTILALLSFKKKVKTLIAGGFDRGLDFKNLAKEIKNQGVETLILFPKTGEKIKKEVEKLDKERKISIFLVNSMKEAVKLAFKKTPKEKVCLLSPASPSFGMFANYRERGNLFKKYVKYYGKK
ncbi:UDP-N-acetylmuramoyl-L-alanine--D-glutamate ligase, partial [Candidatus Parcubacteria bacterium]|nr:UDP-N-acetylmuramoyl-L-alanine--D-glutamate ligase [Candidatus Parcubacteria bacterium]